MRGSVRGYVVRADDAAPVPDADVFVVRGPGPAPDVAAVTDQWGSFALDDLPEGEWVLQARGPDGEIGVTAVTIYDNAVTDATIKLAPRGLVTPAGGV